jgi:hypothetical protein
MGAVALRASVDVDRAPVPAVQSAVLAKSLKVTVPVAPLPPVIVAVSWMTVPTGPPGDAVVSMVGDATQPCAGTRSQ